MRTLLLVLFVLGFVAGEQQMDGQSDGPFGVAAYEVNWSPRTAPAASTTLPPSSSDGREATPRSKWCNPPRQQLKAKRGILFLQRNLFDGAVLPANTELGHVHTRPSIPSTGLASPPLAYSNLRNILAFYNITRGSERARQVAATLLFCRDQRKDEPHVCAATQQAAMEFAAAALGTPTPRAERTVVHGRGVPLRYMVAPNGVTAIGGGGKVVPCHPLPYPGDLLYCHRPGNVRAVRVELVGQDDPSLGATAIAVCHEKTDGWDPEYFAMLNGTRGEPVCHYMPEKYVLFFFFDRKRSTCCG